ncbi:MAG: FAD-dependent oxidoreductase [Parasphingopyxis sp.]|uniref:FAD-dependent oxidoreductase n=1 Tax=Parasphingopyxis sp. TaxID=1920299 RepID=UPI003FA05FB5
MRIANKGVARDAEPFEFRFDDRTVAAHPGETIAAALTNADIWALRKTRSGGSRGVFCGMGVCGECAVLVDGKQRRACLEYAREGIAVETMPACAPAVAPGQACPAARLETIRPQLLVVGAGPAGLAAAGTAARAGLDVVVVDERSGAGGQYFKQPGHGFAVDETALDHQFREGRRLIDEVRAAGARILSAATVWGAFGPHELMIDVDGTALRAEPARIVLSPGAYERPHIFPGWTLPGVLTTGAAQTLLRAYQSAPGRRVLVAGNGPLNLQVAHELVRAGADVVALAELAAPPWRAPPGAAFRAFGTAPSLAAAGLGHLRALRAAGVRTFYGHAVIRAEGDGKVRRATIARVARSGDIEAGSEQSFDVDSLCLGYGFLPQAELGRALGCTQEADGRGSFVFVRDADNRSSAASVFIAGDAGGLGGAPSAQAQGVVAAAAAAGDLGFESDPAELAWARKQLRRHAAFQTALWKIYRPVAPLPLLAEPDTLICRCEEIDRAGIESRLAAGTASLGAVKHALRVGMGRCQGRYCSVVVAELLAARSGTPLSPNAQFAPRAPLKPVPISAVAICPDE